MILEWWADRRRRAILAEPFPDAYRAILAANVPHVELLDDDERTELERMVQVFVAEKNWEGCGGQEIDDEVKVTVAGQACLLILGLDHTLYRNVESILVYPSTVVAPETEVPGTLARGGVPILGQVMRGGPVILAWDAVKHGAHNPGDGKNVVYHEFAHKLDLLDGAADGTPPLDREQYDAWVDACGRAYVELVARSERNRKTFLDDYGATNEAEFFAVATEFFFEKPTQMRKKHPALYAVLRDFYRQDPAERRVRADQSA
ncbi:MAG: zinc-dependent peptidase [Deltaproteobacteria bacterium]|jgi:Mlc titration factor MtfA (ptsG expression regulator)